MTLSPLARRRARYLVPLSAAAIAAIVVIAPQAASGAQHPNLPARTAAQLLSSLENSHAPQFSGTTVETARLGLPSLSSEDLPGGISAGSGSQLMQLVTLLTGSHTAQVAYGGPERQRVAIFLGDLSETDIVHNGTNLWTYNSDTNSVTHSTVKQDASDSTAPAEAAPVDPTRAAEQALAKINPSTAVTVDRTAEVAGRSAYQLDLAPRDSRTLVSSIRIALDAKTAMPLRVQIWSRQNSSSPAFEVGFTSLTMKAPSASTFDFSTPPSASTQRAPFSGEPGPSSAPTVGHAEGSKVVGKDWTSVLVDRLGDNSPPATVPSQPMPDPSKTSKSAAARVHRVGSSGLLQALNEVATPVAGGRVITTSLVSVFITSDNRLLVGAVSPEFLEHLAATKAGR